jgi:hypothetical protein
MKDPSRSASYRDLHVEIDNEVRLRTQLYDTKDDFNFPKIRRGLPKTKYSTYVAYSFL